MRILQLIDSLEVGGAERMSVSLANELAHQDVSSFLCATREEGPIKDSIGEKVIYTFLKKKKTYDISALLRLYRWVKKHKIEVIHAHSSSFFFAYLIKLMRPGIALIWHDHYGNSEALEERSHRALRYCSRKFEAVISVNTILRDWAQERLQCKKVHFIKNFVSELPGDAPSTQIQGAHEFNIVCLANIRPQKDHANMIQAFELVQRKYPSTGLHLIGKITPGDYYQGLLKLIDKKAVQNVYFYGAQTGILKLLKTFGIGVLSSKSEGLPVALLEYGIAGLAVVCTAVGQIPEVVGETGIVVPPEDPQALAQGMIQYIDDAGFRTEMAQNFQQRVRSEYSVQSAVAKLLAIYKGKE